MPNTNKKLGKWKKISDKNKDIESKLFELRALRNRARKRRGNNELELAKKLYSQAIEVAKELKSGEEVKKIEKIINKIELDIILHRLEEIEQELIQLKSSN
ncbi:MAG: hypothetical protein ACTSQI_16240 [Candidatus Helarchaeota archaeon]